MTQSDPARGAQRTFSEVPADLIRDAAKNVPEVLIRIKRRNARGQLANVAGMSGLRKPTLELLEIETWVGDTLGGGNYRIEVASAHNPMEEPPVPPFSFEIEGPPKMHSAAEMGGGIPGFRTPQIIPAGGYASQIAPGSPMAASPYGGAVQIPPAGLHAAQQNGGVLPPMPGLSGFAAGLPPALQWSGYGWNTQGDQTTAPGASMSSDQVAMHTANQLREDNLKLQKQVEEIRAGIDASHEAHRQELLKRDEDLRKLHEAQKDREHKLELQLLEKKFEALAAGQKAPPPPDTMAQMVPILTALAPVFGAMVQANAQAQTRQTEMQLKMMEAQMKRPENKAMEWAPLLAAGAPIVMKFMEQRGPEAQSAVWETMMQNNMQSLSLIGSFMSEMAKGQGEQSPWLPLIQSVMEGGMSTLAAYMESKQGQQRPQLPVIHAGGQARPLGPPPAQPPQAQPQQSQQHSRPATYTTQAAEPQEAIPGSYQKVAIDAAAVARAVAQAPTVPSDFKSETWLALITAIHRQDDPLALGFEIASHVEQLTDDELLPELLRDVWGDPEHAFATLLGGLPISQVNPPYANILIGVLVDQIEMRLNTMQPQKAVVTPAPAEQARQDDDSHANGISPDAVVTSSNVIPLQQPTHV